MLLLSTWLINRIYKTSEYQVFISNEGKKTISTLLCQCYFSVVYFIIYELKCDQDNGNTNDLVLFSLFDLIVYLFRICLAV